MPVEDLLQHTKAIKKQKKQSNVVGAVGKLVEDFLWELNEDEQYETESYGGEREKGFHPSSICYANCARKLVFEYAGVPADFPEEMFVDPGLRRIFDNGHDVHDRWQRYFTLMSKKYGDKIKLLGDWRCKGCGFKLSPDKEIPFPPERQDCSGCGHAAPRWKYNEFRVYKKDLRLVGKRDGKILFGGEEILLEIKSMRTEQHKYLARPTIPHIKQFSLYMLMTGVHKGLFLYENKNDQSLKFFFHEFDSKDIEDELNLLKEANEGIDNKKLPKRLKNFPGLRICKECPWRKTCAKRVHRIKF
jgi:CRISPR/Cas system-associated exonuclease Cas4 (RecB family)